MLSQFNEHTHTHRERESQTLPFTHQSLRMQVTLNTCLVEWVNDSLEDHVPSGGATGPVVSRILGNAKLSFTLLGM